MQNMTVKQEEKKAFWDALDEVVITMPDIETLHIVGNLNTKVGKL